MASGLPFLASVNKIQGTVSLLVSDAIGILNLFAPPQWGIYLNGFAVLTPDSIVSVEVKADWRVADFPQEAGTFESYNKVREPIEIKVTMTKGRAQSGVAGVIAPITGLLGINKHQSVHDFMQTLLTAAGSTTVYAVLERDGIWPNMTMDHFDFRRTAQNGASLLTVDVWFREIRVPVPASSNTAAPSGANPANTGQVQASPVGTNPANGLPLGASAADNAAASSALANMSHT